MAILVIQFTYEYTSLNMLKTELCMRNYYNVFLIYSLEINGGPPVPRKLTAGERKYHLTAVWIIEHLMSLSNYFFQ